MSRITRRGVALAVIATLSAVIASVAFGGASGVQELQPLEPAPSADGGTLINETAKYWFVQFPTAPLADGSAAAEVSADAAEFRSEAKAEGAKYSERMRFQTLWNGMSIEASTAAISTIEGLSSVEAVYPVGTYPIPSTPTVSPDLATAIQMTGASIAQNTLGLTGKGIDVAVMDTGIDYHHPDLGGAFGKGKRVFKGFDFVGNAYTGANTPVPDPDPDDCNGHGTHVAGIVGANGFVKGVAPEVRFGAYRVFGCTGFTTDEVMIAAMERALRDDMDVLNMSIGDAFNNWPGTPTAAASDRLVRKGMVVVASIGNSGANGLYAAGAPGVGSKVIGTASYDNQFLSLRTFTASPDSRVVGYGQASASPLAPVTGSDMLARTGTQTSAADACTALPPGSLTGFYALIRRGTCGFYVKALNAMNAGAKGVVIYNNAPPFQGFITVDPAVGGFPGGTPITIPVVNISGVDGNELDTRLAGGGPVTISWTGNFTQLPVATQGLISGFSSYGLAADLSLKPDIGAPGGFILSTIPLELGAHGSNSGTSMASPHVAGAAALLLQSMKGKGDDDDDDDDDDDRAERVRDILQNSADPSLWQGNPTLGLLDQTHRQGAGMLDIDDAIKAKTLVTPGKLSLGEGTAAITKRLKVRNDSKSTVTYAISHAPATATGPNTFVVATFNAPATVTFSTASLTVGKRSSRNVEVTITPNAGLADRSLYGGYIVLTPNDGSPPLRVPYAGFKGDYQSIPILTSGNQTVPFPKLGRTTNGTLFSFIPPASNVFDLVGIAGQPNATYHMDHQARRVTLWILAADGTVLGRGPELEFHARNSTATGFFALAWDGTFLTGKKFKNKVTAPDGEYRFMLTAEKPLAEKNNPAHVESVTLPGSFIIDRP